MKTDKSAIKVSGIVSTHAEHITNTARQNKCVIMIRQVNEYSTDLIEEGYATKGLNVKAKSSDWGPQAGFICCDQNFSKLLKKAPEEIPESNEKVKASLHNKSALAVPLLISEARVKYLFRKKQIHLISKKNGTYHITTSGKPHYEFLLYPNAAMIRGDRPRVYNRHKANLGKMFRHLPVLKSGYWVMLKEANKPEAEELMVLAEPKTAVPLTADYDLFCVAPNLERFKPKNTPKSFKKAANIVVSALAQKQRRYAHPDLGKISIVTRQVKEQINQKISSKKTVHHGCEVDNPKTELDYPITAFTPWNEIVSAENQGELQSVVRDIIKLNYVFYANRLWSQVGAINSNSEKDGIARDYQWDDRLSISPDMKLEVLNPPREYLAFMGN